MRAAALIVVLSSGCAATLVQGSMPNPARSSEKIESSQTYEIGPYKENHQYELALFGWTATSIGLRIKLTEIEHCALPATYSFTLVDEHGGRVDFKPDADATTQTAPGRAGATVTIANQTGTFATAVSADTRLVTIEVRPRQGEACPSLDFKWTLN